MCIANDDRIFFFRVKTKESNEIETKQGSRPKKNVSSLYVEFSSLNNNYYDKTTRISKQKNIINTGVKRKYTARVRLSTEFTIDGSFQFHHILVKYNLFYVKLCE